MTFKQPFAPKYQSNQNLTASTTSQTATIGAGNKQMRIANKGTGDVFVRAFSNADQPATVATTADFCVLSGQTSTITIDMKYDRVAYITDTGTPAFKIMTGEGF